MEIDRRRLLASLAALPLATTGQSARAQSGGAPLDATKVVIGFAPGGTIDLVGRRVADKLQPGFARTAIVENRTGAGGQIAAQTVRAAPPDGSTVLLTPTSPMSLHLFTYRKVAYDPVADFTPVSGAAMFDYALAVGPLVPASVRTVQEFLAWARANPMHANFGTAGQGSAAHFIGAALAKAAGADLRHVAFRGSQPALADMIGSQLPAVVGPTGEFMANVRGGRVRLLGTSGPRRGRLTPEVPTLAEQGFSDLAYIGWFGFFLPAKASPDVVQRLNAAIRSALAAPEVVDSLATGFMEPMPTAPGQLASMLKTETEFWARLVKAVGFTPEG